MSALGEQAFPAVDALVARGVPLVLTTGCGEPDLPERFRDVPRCPKPVNMRLAARVAGQALNG